LARPWARNRARRTLISRDADTEPRCVRATCRY
jgi:hypothetical protein